MQKRRHGAILWPLLGLAAALLSALAFPILTGSFEQSPLRVSLRIPDIAPGPSADLGGQRPDGLRIDGKRVGAETATTPGLHRLSWTRSYMGGHSRTVGHTQLVGPFQRPEAPECSLSLLIAPSFLVQVAPILEHLVDGELQGMKQWPIGRYLSTSKTELSWVAWGDGPGPTFLRAALREELPNASFEGHLRLFMHIEFEKAKVPLVLTVIPVIDGEVLRFRIAVFAKLDHDSRIVQWVSDFFDGNDRISNLIEGQVEGELRHVLDKPPSIPLAGGASLEVRFCADEQLRFHEAGHVSMPLALRVGDHDILPPKYEDSGSAVSAPMTTPLALELGHNALAAVLHALWASQLLDRTLAQTTVSAFNEHPTVRDFLSVRIADAAFHLPPTAQIQADKTLSLRAAASLRFTDDGVTTPANLYAQFHVSSDFIRAPAQERPASSPGITLGELGLSCTQNGVLTPCYSQIIAQVRANQDELQKELAGQLRDLLLRLFSKRTIQAQGAPASFQLESTEFLVDGSRLRANLVGRAEANR